MKNRLTVGLAAVLCLLVAISSATAAEKAAPKKGRGGPARGVVKKDQEVTQADLAQLLVQVLGLARFLPPKPSDQQCFAVLMHNGIAPKEGWKANQIVTQGDLARVIVQAMKRQGEIRNPDNDAEWIDYLKSLGIPVVAMSEAASYLSPLPEPVAPHVISGQVDPLVKRHRFNPVDETQYGVDMEYIMRVLSKLEFEQGEFRPKPVTPT